MQLIVTSHNNKTQILHSHLDEDGEWSFIVEEQEDEFCRHPMEKLHQLLPDDDEALLVCSVCGRLFGQTPR